MSLLRPALPAVLALLLGCSLVTPFTVGPGRTDASTDADVEPADSDAPPTDGDAPPADGDAGSDGDADDGGPAEGDSVTFVSKGVAITADRVFDLDGDGDLDNAVADLGEPASAQFALIVNALLTTSLVRESRWLIHVPYPADPVRLTDPEATIIFAEGVDDEHVAACPTGCTFPCPADCDPMCPDGCTPPCAGGDPSDDFSGEEGFFAVAHSLDACGEPHNAFEEHPVEGGVFELEQGALDELPAMPLPLTAIRARSAPVEGSSSLLVTLAGVIPAADLARLPLLPSPTGEGPNPLELFLGGGTALGVPGLPGLSPDIDLDGDGLEAFVLDDLGNIDSCVDGDRTVVTGRDCWQDPRFADGFSMTTEWTFARARFSGREPGWQDCRPGECTDPPEQSLFDPPT